ncbi:MAG: ABC transporter permease [Bradyrhizobium sp.]|nr:MAG: ABC transporter permease [Bradyrhizobium sp.]
MSLDRPALALRGGPREAQRRTATLFKRHQNFALLILFLALFAFFSFFTRRFFSAPNIEDILSGYSFMAILAVGQAFPIMTRGLDLSIGSNVGLGAMILFDLDKVFHLPGWASIPISVTACALAGCVNGLLVTQLKLQPFVATLATLAAFRGTVYAVSGRQLYPELATQSVKDPWIRSLEGFLDIGHLTGLSRFVRLPSLPFSFLALLVVAVLAHVVLNRTRLGLNLKTVGGNPEAAHLAGVSVRRTQIVAYLACGLCAGIVAVLLVARFTTATEATGTGMELTTIAAAVIGGVTLRGGSGTVAGPILGAFLLGIILIGLTLMGISQFTQQILTGAILLGAVYYDRLTSDRQKSASGGVA